MGQSWLRMAVQGRMLCKAQGRLLEAMLRELGTGSGCLGSNSLSSLPSGCEKKKAAQNHRPQGLADRGIHPPTTSWCLMFRAFEFWS